MEASILDNRQDGNSKCYLCRISLEDYVLGLPESYQEYDVQREIVTNIYLDHLVDTILDKRHIPAIVLVVEDNKYSVQDNTLHIEGNRPIDR